MVIRVSCVKMSTSNGNEKSEKKDGNGFCQNKAIYDQKYFNRRPGQYMKLYMHLLDMTDQEIQELTSRMYNIRDGVDKTKLLTNFDHYNFLLAANPAATIELRSEIITTSCKTEESDHIFTLFIIENGQLSMIKKTNPVFFCAKMLITSFAFE